MLNKTVASPASTQAVRAQAGIGAGPFFVVVPNPRHAMFGHVGSDTRNGQALLAFALPVLPAAAEADIQGRVARSSGAYDDSCGVGYRSVRRCHAGTTGIRCLALAPRGLGAPSQWTWRTGHGDSCGSGCLIARRRQHVSLQDGASAHRGSRAAESVSSFLRKC